MGAASVLAARGVWEMRPFGLCGMRDLVAAALLTTAVCAGLAAAGEVLTVTTFAGSAGHVGSADGTGSAARFFDPCGVAVDGSGNVYVADRANSTIRKITPAGVVTTLAGSPMTIGTEDGIGSAARFSYPRGVAVDGSGNVYVADTNSSTIRKVTSTGVVTTFAGLANTIGTADGTGSAARFRCPEAIAVDGSGNVFVADTMNCTIRKITPSRVVTTYAGLAEVSGLVDGTGSAARFMTVSGLAADSAGNVYVADGNRVRKITPSRVVTTLAGDSIAGNADGTGAAAQFWRVVGLGVDSGGNVYAVDSGANHTVRRISPAGAVTTVAGSAGSSGSADGVGSAARFFTPLGLAVSSANTVYVVDSVNNTIRKGVPTTVYGVIASAGANGTIVPSGTVPVCGGASQTFAITPDAGYAVSDLTVDGLAVGAAGSYTFTNVSADHTIAASFMPGCVIASSAGPNGSVSPSGPVSVVKGTDRTFTIVPDASCIIADVLVDGVSQGAITSYTFTDVQAAHTISASFIRQWTVTATAGANGAITPSGAVVVNAGADRAFAITPDADYAVASLLVDGVAVAGNPTDYTFSAVAANHAISVSFSKPPVAANLSVLAVKGVARAVTLSAADPEGAAVTYAIVSGPSHGTLTGSGAARSYTGSAVGADSFTYQATDAAGAVSNVATVTITVKASNVAPVAPAQAVSTAENVAKALVLAATDGDGDALAYTVTTAPLHGTLSGTAPNLTYTPDQHWNGTDSFKYKVFDGIVYSAIATVTVGVTAVNFSPEISGLSPASPVTVAAGTTQAFEADAWDPDGDGLSYSWELDGVGTGVVLNAFNYSPRGADAGAHTVKVTVSDGHGGTDSRIWNVTVTNDAPAATDLGVTTEEDAAVVVTLPATDANGDALTYTIVSGPAHGALQGEGGPTVFTGGDLIYTPAADWNGAETITYKVNDGAADSGVGTVTITVTAVNDAPVAGAQAVTTNEDTAKAITLAATDAEGSGLSWTVVVSPAHGVLSGTAPDLTYTPAENYAGADSFAFRVNDGAVDSNVATVAITVTAVNDAPVASDQAVVTKVSTAKAITLRATDVDSTALTYEIVAQPGHGTVTAGTTAAHTYTPTAGWSGTDTFTFRAKDGALYSNVATVTVEVTNVNAAPVAAAQSVVTKVSTAKAIVLVATDANGNALMYTVMAGPSHGTVTAGAAANRTYTPMPGWNGTDTFTFKASDGTADSNVATVTVKVDAVPVITGPATLAVTEDEARAVTLGATDADGDTLTYAITTAPLHGTLSGTAPNLTYTPAAHYKGTDSFQWKVNDGSFDSAIATVAITVASVNDAPVARDQTVVTKMSTAKAVVLGASDADLNTLTYHLVGSPAHGTVSAGTSANRTYTPTPGWTGTDSFTFRAYDGTVYSNVATVTVTVASIDDPPVANPQTVVTNEDVSKAIVLTSTDPYADVNTYKIVSPPAHGTITSGTTAKRTYKPNANYNGPDSFAFKVRDARGHWSNVAIVRLTVLPIDDKPVVAAKTVSVANNATVDITLGSATDVDNQALVYTVAPLPLHGTISWPAANRVAYTPTAGYVGVDTFSFKASDGRNLSAIVKATITVIAP